jgi:hypothetical protein
LPKRQYDQQHTDASEAKHPSSTPNGGSPTQQLPRVCLSVCLSPATPPKPVCLSVCLSVFNPATPRSLSVRRVEQGCTRHPDTAWQVSSLKPVGYKRSYMACKIRALGPYLAATNRSLISVSQSGAFEIFRQCGRIILDIWGAALQCSLAFGNEQARSPQSPAAQLCRPPPTLPLQSFPS